MKKSANILLVVVAIAITLYFVYPYITPVKKTYTLPVSTSGGALNNPGNIRIGGTRFLGEVESTGPFRSFETLAYGYRAVMKILLTYAGRGLDTISEIIYTYAPPSDNNPTNSYVSFVSKGTGISSSEKISLSKDVLISLVKYMTMFEQGSKFGYYPDELEQAYNLL